MGGAAPVRNRVAGIVNDFVSVLDGNAGRVQVGGEQQGGGAYCSDASCCANRSERNCVSAM